VSDDYELENYMSLSAQQAEEQLGEVFYAILDELEDEYDGI